MKLEALRISEVVASAMVVPAHGGWTCTTTGWGNGLMLDPVSWANKDEL